MRLSSSVLETWVSKFRFSRLDIFWLNYESLEDTENLPALEILAQEIVEQLGAALEEFWSVEDVFVNLWE